MVDLFNPEEWGPDIERASEDELWIMSELSRRSPTFWQWFKSDVKKGFDLFCKADIKVIAVVEVEGMPLGEDGEDKWPTGYQYPTKWKYGITIPRRKLEDYIMPWFNTWSKHRIPAYFIKCNNAHTEAFAVTAGAFIKGQEVTIRHNATPERMRRHDLQRRDRMVAVPPPDAVFGVPQVFDWLIEDIKGGGEAPPAATTTAPPKGTQMLTEERTQILEIWQRSGRPAIPLRQGEVCRDLEKFLSCSNIRDSDTQALRAWAQNKELL